MYHDFADNLRDMKDYQQTVILLPAAWRSFQPDPPLNWQCVKFGEDAVDDVPLQRGIYTFVVQFQTHSNLPLLLPPHGYVMYGGITDRTLRHRYRDYLREQKRPKRLQIWSMLNKWRDDLFFHFSPVDDAQDLEALETALNDAVMPPYVTKDFSAEVRELIRVLRTN